MRYAMLLVALAATLSRVACADPPAPEPQIVRPAIWWSGLNRFSDGGARVEPTTDLVTEVGEFAKLWTRLGLKGEAPHVNFEDHFVLVLVRPLGLDFAVGGLDVDEQGEAKARGMRVHPDNMNSMYHSTTIAVFRRHQIKSIEGKKLQTVAE